MSRQPHIIDREEIRLLIIGAAAHVVLVTSLYLGIIVIGSAARDGLQATTRRLSFTSQIMLARLSPSLDRFDRLMEAPSDFGFSLYETEHESLPPSRLRHPDQPSAPDTPDPGPSDRPSHTDPSPTSRDSSGDHRDLMAFVAMQSDLGRATRDTIIERARTLSFDDFYARGLLLTIRDMADDHDVPEDDRLAFFRAFFSIPPQGLRVTFTREQLSYLTEHHSYAFLCLVTEDARGIAALLNLLPEFQPAEPSTPTSTEPTAVTRPPHPALEKPERPLTREDYRRIEEAETRHAMCLSRQEQITRAFQRYRTASLTEVTALDLSALATTGFLSSPGDCPSGGEYSLDEQGQVTCSIHGNHESPGDDHRRYQAAFHRLNIARETYLAGRHREALFHAERILESQPENYWAKEILARCHMHLGNWRSAATAFVEVAGIVGQDARILFDAGYCFYAADNRTLALENLQRAARASWTTSQRSFTRIRDFHRLQDEARWMASLVPEMRFLEFRLEPEPAFPTDTCAERLSALRDHLEELTDEYRNSPGVAMVSRELQNLEEQLSFLREFETEERRNLQERIQDARRRLSARLRSPGPAGLMAHIEESIVNETTAPSCRCPLGDRYYVDSFSILQCAHHQNILVRGNLSEDMHLDGSSIKLLNDVLLRAALRDADDKRVCFDRQQSLLEHLDAPINARRLEALRRSSPMLNVTQCPLTDEPYETTSDDSLSDEAILCPTHGSWQLFRRVPGVIR